jgi:hypothetical protein
MISEVMAMAPLPSQFAKGDHLKIAGVKMYALNSNFPWKNRRSKSAHDLARREKRGVRQNGEKRQFWTLVARERDLRSLLLTHSITI